MVDESIQKLGQQNLVVYSFFIKLLNSLLYSIIELVFLLIITFVSFISVIEPYERIKVERDSQKTKHQYFVYILKRLVSYFVLGLPFIYLGLKMSALEPISVNLNIDNIYQLILNLLLTIAKIPLEFYILIFIPTIIIVLVKIYTEKAWFDLNKESRKLFNERLQSFRDKRFIANIYEKTKESKRKEFRRFILDYIRNSPVSFIVSGIIFLQIISTSYLLVFTGDFKYVLVYMIPLSSAWLLISIFFTIFEGQISKLTEAVIEAIDFLKRDKEIYE